MGQAPEVYLVPPAGSLIPNGPPMACAGPSVRVPEAAVVSVAQPCTLEPPAAGKGRGFAQVEVVPMSEKKEIDPEVIAQLRSHALTNRPSDVLRLLIRLVPGL